MKENLTETGCWSTLK